MINIKKMDSDQLDIFISDYNWDDGFHSPQMVIDNSNCELATAINTFYLADGYSYFLNKINDGTEWFQFVSGLYERILKGNFSKGNLSYKVPLTKTQIYKIRKNNVPEVFLNDIL